jgi:glycosyltransferase involved in cell wall biosynthesis
MELPCNENGGRATNRRMSDRLDSAKPTRVSIVIPIFNEASTVRTLLDRVYDQPLTGMEKELVIVESKSADGTREIVQEFCREKNSPLVRLLLQEIPRGKGNAVREGLRACTGEIVLIQDGDLEYDVADYPALLQPMLDGRAQFVLGSRHMAAGNWKIRHFEEARLTTYLLNLGGIFFHAFFNVMYGQKLTDPTTMYKVFRRDCLDCFELVSNRFDFDYEIVAKLIRAGFPPLEVPVSYVSRGFDRGKKVHIFRDPWTWIWAIVRFRFCALRPSK